MLAFSLSLLLAVTGASSEQLKPLYHGLDQQSVVQHLAFHELYPETPEGKQALQRAIELLGGSDVEGLSEDLFTTDRFLPCVQRLVFHRQGELEPLDEKQLRAIDQLASSLHNRTLKGHTIWTLKELLQLDPEQIDLSRGLLLSLLGEGPEHRQTIRTYEAYLDLMALQIRARLPILATPRHHIDATNHLLFEELHLRFPPYSAHTAHIEAYTFLPSVLDSRRGVCLGLSSLYLCLAQRLGLSLEAITPPGHIYIRYRDSHDEINVETTARGIHVPTKAYLGIETSKLPVRTLKEVIGLTFFNQGATFWQNHQHQEAIEAYSKALEFVPDDPLTLEFLGYNLWLEGEIDPARDTLKQICVQTDTPTTPHQTAVTDLLAGKTDIEGIQVAFLPVDETRASLEAKRTALEQTVEKWPTFRMGWFQLAITHLQLGREREALDALRTCHGLIPNDLTVTYYLSALSASRHDYPKAWTYLRQAEQLIDPINPVPRPLSQLRRALRLENPEPPRTH